ncbi:oligopeptide ABC transporter ATP-binding protein [Spiroplasma sabaudiense Ar-1343]|uniref:Oligopeptide ABC transporter ATP-binding protein n=1 Tax=Spiroplasma sabaudiense Ar-1343 TaxID=1276257 RepID=W6AAH4_9MOLU|nr:oligopeptide ABC transporter ATP-binding protein OppF [Spiroplasma sabaudiense]AHI54183.1 oligopeptide ABC transporter ATP-binding protein [Spiroplasma sabaudiense Ar-1343]
MKINEKEPFIMVRDLEVQFRAKGKVFKAIKGVNFDVLKGETLGLVGESGSGKTTIGRALMGIQPIHDGTVYLENNVIGGKLPNLNFMNKKILDKISDMTLNINASIVALNNYIKSAKITYYKYVENKNYNPKTNELVEFTKNDFTLNDNTNFYKKISTNDWSAKQFELVKSLIHSNLKSLISVINLQKRLIRFVDNLSSYIPEIDPKIEKSILKKQNETMDLVLQTKKLNNQIYENILKIEVIRKKFRRKEYKSLVDFFNDIFRILKDVTLGCRKSSKIFLTISDNHKMNVALSSCKKNRQKQIQYYESLTSVNKTEFVTELEKRLTKLDGEVEMSKDSKAINEIYQKTLNEITNLETDTINEIRLVEIYRRLLNNDEVPTIQLEAIHELLEFLKLPAIDDVIKQSKFFVLQTAKSRRELKKRMQMIFQDPAASLNDRMAVGQIIGEGLENFPELYKNDESRNAYVEFYNSNLKEGQEALTIDKVKDNDVKQFLIISLLKEVGLLSEHLSRYPHEFSGGQRQRIGIARALVMHPEFVVADEPISALDVSIRAQVLNLLKQFQDKFNLTYIFVAHDLSVVRFIADRIAVIYHGEIVELAEANELFNNPMHPYTKSLLTAIPLPDPKQEKKKIHIDYNPEEVHADYIFDVPEFVEITPGHFVLANSREFNQLINK